MWVAPHQAVMTRRVSAIFVVKMHDVIHHEDSQLIPWLRMAAIGRWIAVSSTAMTGMEDFLIRLRDLRHDPKCSG